MFRSFGNTGKITAIGIMRIPGYTELDDPINQMGRWRAMKSAEVNVVGVSEAKTHFSEILARAAGGEEITITRHGAPVARLVPSRSGSSPDRRRVAVERMRQLAGRNRLNGLRIRDLISEGRK